MVRGTKKEETKKKLLNVFSELSIKKSYFDLTISDIARRADISASSFYTYYDSKRDLLQNYMNEALGRLRYLLREQIKPKENIMSVIRKTIYMLSTSCNDLYLQSLHRVLRELEFVDRGIATQYYQEVLAIIKELLINTYPSLNYLDNEMINALSVMIIGATQFIYLFRNILNVEDNYLLDIEVAGDVILKGLGLDKDVKIDIKSLFSTPPSLEELVEKYRIYKIVGDKTSRQRMIKSALKLLSKKSFRELKVFEVTTNAGYAVGMFYKIYNNKNDLLRDVVIILGKTLRRFLTECALANDPLESEIRGLACFLSFVSKNGQIYRIVRESEYIDVNIAKEYYTEFMERYNRRISEIKDKIVTYNSRSLAISLMGINHLAGIMGPMLKIIDSRDLLVKISKIYSKGVINLIV